MSYVAFNTFDSLYEPAVGQYNVLGPLPAKDRGIYFDGVDDYV